MSERTFCLDTNYGFFESADWPDNGKPKWSVFQSLRGLISFHKIWLGIIAFGFVLFLLSSNSGREITWNCAEELIIEVSAPLQKLINQSINSTEGLWYNYFDLINVRQDNKDLQMEIDLLKMENSRYRDLLATHKRLQELLKFTNSINRPVVAAQVIGLDPTGWFKSIIIDKGKDAGISLNMPVVNADGVVGKIVSTSPNYAKVLLVIDQNSSVDCLVRRTRDRGMVKGLSAVISKLDYVVKCSDVVAGDIIVTSGLGGIFPKALPVGKVLNVQDLPGELFKEIKVSPAVDFSKLEEVLVILKEDTSLNYQLEKE